ncbi:triacylglycerol lipase OBL1-like [Argentina anserina]|uniref:triacylglycerol lipase OBL1-like n=1 Tax=Argentina anserina TaxID=57926 RepID=UPI0021764FC1|nr:triacylglycerol lipase OBL1-like [Potentilla anserina]
MASKESVCDSYLSLKPEKATIIEIIRSLFSSDLENERFIESSEEGKLERKWIILVSVIVQWVFLYIRVPLAKIGDVLQKWLNLISINGGLLMLFLNWLRGKVVEPDSLSSRSVLGNLDTRIELDKSIKPENTRYKAVLSIMAAKLSYENKDLVQSVVNHHWKMKFIGFYNFWNGYQGRDSTQAFLFKDTQSDPNLIVVAFRGTAPFNADAWRIDFDISWCQFNKVGKTHGGFMKALGMQPENRWPLELENDDQHSQFAYYTIRKMLKDLLQEDENAKFILTGHSLGGALAVLFAGVLAMHDCEYAWLLERLEGVYTFGQPRVGDEKFGEFMKEKFRNHDVRYMRYVYNNDLVPRVPFDDKALLFEHFGPTLYYNSCYGGKVLKEEPNKNYFSLRWFIPNRLNAVWELIRSFILPLVKGSEYREGWFMRLWRVAGLVFPGIPDHIPQDYVNLTRLGTLLLPKETPKVQHSE